MSQIGDTLDALAAVISTTGLRSQGTVPGQIVTPAAVVWVDSITYSSALHGGAHDLSVACLVLVATVEDRTSQDALHAYLDPTGAQSVYEAVNLNPTLSGVVDSAVVLAVPEGQAGLVEYAGVSYRGARLNVSVLL